MGDYEEQKQMVDELVEALFEDVFVGDLRAMHILDCLQDCELRLERVTKGAEPDYEAAARLLRLREGGMTPDD